MNWQAVAVLGLLLVSSVALVALQQVTIAGILITSAISLVALVANAKPKDEPSLPANTTPPNGDDN